MRNFSDILLDPAETAIVIVDHQPQMYFGVESAPRAVILKNIVALAKTAQVFGVPCVLTTVAEKEFSGLLLSKIQSVYPGVVPINRTSINAWEDQNLKKAVLGTRKKNILFAGLWTEACVTFPALSAKSEGHNVYVVTDACGGATREAHDMAVSRMTQQGVIPVTWQQVLLEFQRDWNNKDTYNAVMGVVQEFSGAYGIGVEYANTMLQ
ncbi:MAG: hydrolase [Oscillospiraceae bacterium]|jgi:nicotinamidase-related amidase|nr:hydrolase [Oscillospiraceae bacterium]